MTSYRVDPAGCEGVFASVEVSVSSVEGERGVVSAAVDEVSAVCADAKSAAIGSAIAGVWNRVFAAGMTGAVQQARNAVAGGRSAVGYIQQGDAVMVEQTERAAHSFDDVTVLDGKAVR